MGRPRIDLSGKAFGRLTVLRYLDIRANKSVVWECECECGNVVGVPSGCLRRKKEPTVSCGCYRKTKSIKHGARKHPLYRVWGNMIQRCSNKKTREYRHYGGKGVSVCADWIDFSSFYDWAMGSGYEHGLTIDRIDPNGNYEPSNCRFITRSENTRRSNFGLCRNKKS